MIQRTVNGRQFYILTMGFLSLFLVQYTLVFDLVYINS